MILSRGARLCEQIIRCAKPRRGGARQVGRPYLARRLGCSTRTVSRYLRELREAGRLAVTPPRRVKRRDGWRTEGVNTYRLTEPANPAPHVARAQNRRSRRGDTHVTPSPYGDRVGGPTAARTPATDRLDPFATARRLFGDQLIGATP